MTYLTSSSQPHAVTFGEFRDFLLLLPRKVSTAEIYRYYQVRKFMGDDGRGTGRVTMEGERPPHLALSHASLQLLPLQAMSPSVQKTSRQSHHHTSLDPPLSPSAARQR